MKAGRVLTTRFLSSLPNEPAVYALYGGHGSAAHVAYTGIAGKLRQRVAQHLVLRDSSVATGTSAAVLNPDYVTRVEWWTRPEFSDRSVLEAAELVAFEVLNPALRSRGTTSAAARACYEDADFRARMREVFEGEPDESLDVPTLATALQRIEELEERLRVLEDKVDGS